MEHDARLDGTQRGGCRSLGSRVFLTLFFAVFLLAGVGFTGVVLIDAVRATAVWFWPEVECTVISSGVEETGDDHEPYRSSVRFEYRVDGRTYEGREVARGATGSSSYDKARRPSDRHPPGSRTTCRVNPDLPSDAVLERRLPWTALLVLLPLIFVAVGAGGIYVTWKGFPGLGRSSSEDSISQRAREGKNLGRRVELGVGLLFALIGGSLSLFLLVLPAVRLVAATAWVERPATIKASTVRSWSTDDGTSYGADVLYEYEIDGRSWISNRRSFFPMDPSGYDANKAIVDDYPTGGAATCFVDADDPTRSVLDRSFSAVYLIGLFPLVFLLAGTGLTAHALRARRPATPTPPDPTSETVSDEAERVLEPAAGPVAKVFGMLFIAAFWNGIVSVFAWQVVASFRRGDPEWFLTVFLTPFVVVGLALVVGVFSAILASFNPRPRLTIQPASPRLGSRLHVQWSFRGKASRINRLRIVLEGLEKATYRRGTNSYTDREAFASFDLVDISSDGEIARGSTAVEIPDDTMHSFASANNGVVWSLQVRGEIARWPDVSEDFEVEVRPLAAEGLRP